VSPHDARFTIDFAALLALAFCGYFITKSAKEGEYLEFDNESLTSSPKKERATTRISRPLSKTLVKPLVFNIDLHK
jgi:hypothetical protein